MNEGDKQTVRRDLYWLIESPPLLRDARLQWRPEQAFNPETVGRIPDCQLSRLLQLRDRTLGAYFEGLARALFEASEDFSILAGNRVIQGPQRTLGEIDLLLADHRRQRVVHLELALKFYLRLSPIDGQADDDRLWIGAGQRDFLAIKHQRLLDHQLRLPELALNRGVWPEDLPVPDCSLAWVTGRLFHPHHEAPTSTPLVAPGASSGYWLTLSDFERRPFQGHWVNKAGWLAPIPTVIEAELKHPLPGQFLGTAEPDGPWRHWFVVPDDWPASARNRMLHRFQATPEETDGR